MITKLIAGFGLMALCVAVHAVGLTLAFRWSKRRPELMSGTFGSSTWALIRIACWTVLLHLVEICVFSAFYVWKEALPDFHTAMYFSAVTYTTTGYGDIVLPEPWRLVGGMEALTGILMCGWSTGFFFAVVSRMYTTKVEPGRP